MNQHLPLGLEAELGQPANVGTWGSEGSTVVEGESSTVDVDKVGIVDVVLDEVVETGTKVVEVEVDVEVDVVVGGGGPVSVIASV